MIEKRKKIFKHWYNSLSCEFNKNYWYNITKFLLNEQKLYRICPAINDIFNIFTFTNPKYVKVVIVGQDPYHQIIDNKCIADGIAFSTNHSKTPNSLRNIIIEISRDLDIPPTMELHFQNNLCYLVYQNVMLLNTYLTTRSGISLHHNNINWDKFTGKTLEILSKHRHNLVFILMGNEAQELGANWIQNRNNHLIIETTHPTSKSFKYGSKSLYNSNFATKTNNYLIQHYLTPINWTIF